MGLYVRMATEKITKKLTILGRPTLEQITDCAKQ